ncbi:MAG: transcription termination/antitermination protein NusA, partial [Acidobacteriales bacterium]|nr:transcription termination/antitermination protein NusA [Terriglobales bacterium]
MASALYQSIEAISREKGIDPQVVVAAVEDAIALATRKYYKTNENLRAELNKDTGAITAYVAKSVVATDDEIEDDALQISLDEAQKLNPDVEVGGEIRFPKKIDVLGRIAAQMAKQVIFQKVREAERDTVYNDNIGRVGEIITATVKRIEGQDTIFDIGKGEARMPRRESSRLESFAVGERVRVVISKVEKASKGPQVVISRAAPELVKSLFQTEVPEIYDGTVQIKAIAREAGERTKIAVTSKDKDVDPVGACVGMKGMRVQSIIRELRGEKIDIIEWSEDITTFAEKALQPAKVSRVTILDLANKVLEVVVDDTQLSLAIGKKGQNVRLAAKLLGWKVDIKSEEEKRQEVEQQMRDMETEVATPIQTLTNLSPELIQSLIAGGIESVEQLADMTPEQLEQIPGAAEQIEQIAEAVNNYFSSLGDATEAAPEQAEYASDAAEAGVEITAAPDQLPSENILTPNVHVTPDVSEYHEAENTGQALEAEFVSGVENAPDADVSEVHVSGETADNDA